MIHYGVTKNDAGRASAPRAWRENHRLHGPWTVNSIPRRAHTVGRGVEGLHRVDGQIGKIFRRKQVGTRLLPRTAASRVHCCNASATTDEGVAAFGGRSSPGPLSSATNGAGPTRRGRHRAFRSYKETGATLHEKRHIRFTQVQRLLITRGFVRPSVPRWRVELAQTRLPPRPVGSGTRRNLKKAVAEPLRRDHDVHRHCCHRRPFPSRRGLEICMRRIGTPRESTSPPPRSARQQCWLWVDRAVFFLTHGRRRRHRCRFNLTSLMALTHLFAPLAWWSGRHGGGSSTFASISAFQPQFNAAVYAASKSFVLLFQRGPMARTI